MTDSISNAARRHTQTGAFTFSLFVQIRDGSDVK